MYWDIDNVLGSMINTIEIVDVIIWDVRKSSLSTLITFGLSYKPTALANNIYKLIKGILIFLLAGYGTLWN